MITSNNTSAWSLQGNLHLDCWSKATKRNQLNGFIGGMWIMWAGGENGY